MRNQSTDGVLVIETCHKLFSPWVVLCCIVKCKYLKKRKWENILAIKGGTQWMK